MTAQERKWYNEGYPPNVLCYFADAAQAAGAQRPKGQAKVLGRCAGVTRDPAVWKGYVVTLLDCRPAEGG
jgi:hypothetical protein